MGEDKKRDQVVEKRRPDLPLLSAEPILRLSTRALARQVAARLGGSTDSHARTLARARARGYLRMNTADRVAIAMGTHPVLLWGEAWEHL
jgi:hypothetical protein